MPKSDIFVSVVALCGPDDAPRLAPFVAEVSAILEEEFSHHEILLIYAGPYSALVPSLPSLRALPLVRLIHLSRSLDMEAAVLAGLDAAIGDFVVTAQPAFDPPDVFPALVDLCRGGVDVGIGVADPNAGRSVVYRLLRRVFLMLARRTLQLEPICGATLLRGFSRYAVNAITTARQRQPFFALTLFDIGLGTATFNYELRPTAGVVRRHSTLAALRQGVSIIAKNSSLPLRLVSLLGIFGSFSSVVYSSYAILIYVFKRDVAPGWTTLSLQVSGLFFLLFIMLTLLGEYLGRLLDEVADRPRYHVREEHSSAVPISESFRRNVTYQSVEGGERMEAETEQHE